MVEGGGEDITTGELSRTITSLAQRIDKRFDDLTVVMAGFVTMQLYQADTANVRAELARTEERLQHMEDERDKWRLAIFTAIVAPLVVALIVGAFALKGMKA